MNKNIARLARIASKKSRAIIGLMSGTSMDGLDVALCDISGSGMQTKLKLRAFETVPFHPDVKARIGEVFAKSTIDFELLCILNPWVGQLHADLVLKCLKNWRISPEKIDLIASHGQTVYHSPASQHPEDDINATLQIGDGDQIAVRTGITTISDFRQKHIAKGGEGAPLAVYGDYLLLSHKTENRILLNIGGIANFTYLPAGYQPNKVFVTDTGPGNTLIDHVTRRLFPGEYYDKDAARARQGTVNDNLLKALKADRFFELPFPKTTGPEVFSMGYVQTAQETSDTIDLDPEDVLATLTRFSAETIAAGIRKATGKKKFSIYLSGGGAHNPLLTQWLRELLNVNELRTTEVIGVPGDAKEAILFAVLANETVAGGVTDFGRRSKIPSVSMGKVSFPQ
ncbi:anhydro-N-acetylmuramic acid kinase [Chryseolinea sp. T2]|uniref:anhydro-N-acetylmuramic acid kinase n=1 Tax=Chryseolinea sp. T2 TaxID=3129255 RepID=UPI003077F223